MLFPAAPLYMLPGSRLRECAAERVLCPARSGPSDPVASPLRVAGSVSDIGPGSLDHARWCIEGEHGLRATGYFGGLGKSAALVRQSIEEDLELSGILELCSRAGDCLE